MSNTLYLPLKAKWYEMIERGEKLEEYREIKPYWVRRLAILPPPPCWDYLDPRVCNGLKRDSKIMLMMLMPLFRPFAFRKFDKVKFSYGYTKRTMTFRIEDIALGKGLPEWGAPEKDSVFIIKLGKRYDME